MSARSSPGGFVVATVTNPGSFMATITHPTGNGYCRDRILRDSIDREDYGVQLLSGYPVIESNQESNDKWRPKVKASRGCNTQLK